MPKNIPSIGASASEFHHPKIYIRDQNFDALALAIVQEDRRNRVKMLNGEAPQPVAAIIFPTLDAEKVCNCDSNVGYLRLDQILIGGTHESPPRKRWAPVKLDLLP